MLLKIKGSITIQDMQENRVEVSNSPSFLKVKQFKLQKIKLNPLESYLQQSLD
jgi:hypothetical protein